MELDALLDSCAAGPDLLESALAGFPEGLGDEVPVPGKWSVRQVVCHLADSELIYASRIQLVLVEDNPFLPAAEPSRWVSAFAHHDRRIDEQLALIRGIRRHTLLILRHVDLEAFHRTGVHSEDGPLTLEDLVERLTRHIPHHLPFLQEKIARLTTE